MRHRRQLPLINDFATGGAVRAPATATADGDRQRQPRLSSATTSCAHYRRLLGDYEFTALLQPALCRLQPSSSPLVAECRPARPAHLDSGRSRLPARAASLAACETLPVSKAGADKLSLSLTLPLVCAPSAPTSGSCRPTYTSRAALRCEPRAEVAVQASPSPRDARGPVVGCSSPS